MRIAHFIPILNIVTTNFYGEAFFCMYSFGDEIIGFKETQIGNEYDSLTMQAEHDVSLTEECLYEVPIGCSVCDQLFSINNFTDI